MEFSRQFFDAARRIARAEEMLDPSNIEHVFIMVGLYLELNAACLDYIRRCLAPLVEVEAEIAMAIDYLFRADSKLRALYPGNVRWTDEAPTDG